MKVTPLYFVYFGMFLLLFSCKSETESKKAETVETTLKQLLPTKTAIRILIDKSDYTLSVFASDTLVKEYAVVFGGNPTGDKHKEGDKRTPEGVFGMRDKYPHRNWSKFIWIDYPNADSWKKFNQRKADGIIKDGETIGGEVGIHGVPDGMDHMIDDKRNWTLGCISMKNAAINEIYPYITKRTQIKIQP
ncbi:L,D-transpeptidase [Kordia sp. YSTF-M3]|uniref:L,D-transpeptidase n=1 Tax=Kordia aestuariivivens TaxID=2759037 RepID=A0ABR7QD78_9FLAO|nr:L,D-transpeptidase [Kordia aestuariivivens]MBC8756526.1 L,D-transpeptidase [Kordia aestuariivivens]